MPRKARCKLVVTELVEDGKPGENDTVTLEALYDGDLTDEDESFSKYTPYAELTMGIQNEALGGFFEPGREFYVDLIPVDEAVDGGGN